MNISRSEYECGVEYPGIHSHCIGVITRDQVLCSAMLSPTNITVLDNMNAGYMGSKYTYLLHKLFKFRRHSLKTTYTNYSIVQSPNLRKYVEFLKKNQVVPGVLM